MVICTNDECSGLAAKPLKLEVKGESKAVPLVQAMRALGRVEWEKLQLIPGA